MRKMEKEEIENFLRRNEFRKGNRGDYEEAMELFCEDYKDEDEEFSLYEERLKTISDYFFKESDESDGLFF